MGFGGAVNLSLAHQQRSAAELTGIPADINRTIVGKHNPRGHVGLHRLAGRAHFQTSRHCGHQRVHTQFCVHIRTKSQGAVNADRFKLLRDGAIHRDRRTGRNHHSCAAGGNDFVLPHRRIRPVTRGHRSVRGLRGIDQSQSRLVTASAIRHAGTGKQHPTLADFRRHKAGTVTFLSPLPRRARCCKLTTQRFQPAIFHESFSGDGGAKGAPPGRKQRPNSVPTARPGTARTAVRIRSGPHSQRKRCGTA